MCGEKHVVPFEGDWKLGSPPRVRGKAFLPPAEAAFLGITPACAGKSDKTQQAKELRRDHPRVCGEKAYHKPADNLPAGSPPRVRGKAT